MAVDERSATARKVDGRLRNVLWLHGKLTEADGRCTRMHENLTEVDGGSPGVTGYLIPQEIWHPVPNFLGNMDPPSKFGTPV